ncbi:MAG: AsmA family protein [Candidatus Ancaeobacter aquaticus]|nr:AsmA family protein [Candidatus Ancaeobacter aquaticus]
MKKLLLIVVVLVVVIFVAKDFLIKNAVKKGVNAMTGLTLDVEKINISLMGTSLGIKELKLFNPPQFKERLMMDMPEIYVDLYLEALLKKKIHVESIRLNLKEFIVVKNEKGELNLDSITAVKAVEEKKDTPEDKKEAKMPDIRIDELVLKIGKVKYIDYSKGTPPKVVEVNVNIDERYEDIDDPYKLISLIVFKALVNTSIANLADFDLGPLKGKTAQTIEKAKTLMKDYSSKAMDLTGNLGDSMKGVTSKTFDSDTSLGDKTKEAAAGAKDMMDDAADKIKDIFPFGKKKE